MRTLLSLAAMLVALTAVSQTPSNIEAVEYDPDGNRWFVSNGNSVLVTADQGGNWSFFGEAVASYGMEVMDGVLYAIGNNVIRSYDLSTAELLGECIIPGVSFLNGLGSNGEGLLVVSDFQGERLYSINAQVPSEMTFEQLTGSLGEMPNGVVLDAANNRAIVVCWGSNADILAVDLEDGEVTTLVSGTGLGNLDGIDDDGNGNYYVSSWSPTRITRFNADFSASETVVTGSSGLSSPADISYAVQLDTLGVANSGSDVVTFHGFGGTPNNIESARAFSAERAGMDMLLFSPVGQRVEVTGYDAAGRVLVERVEFLPAGTMRWPWPIDVHAGMVIVRAGGRQITLR